MGASKDAGERRAGTPESDGVEAITAIREGRQAEGGELGMREARVDKLMAMHGAVAVVLISGLNG